ncbi:hypothetical protein [Methylosinus sp. Sm6]|uniref:hypothetical protein n=1 Tax=Methylosinus sp. Sm6 TaxID=2866948 RepID=UPI001C9A26B3|nr:hypothetical protein [Methylosinus sp. Sm6]MBY6242817.1 hypothetical protein [Methylosinus sp. Sm6]
MRKDSSRGGKFSRNARRISRALDSAARDRVSDFLRRAHPLKTGEWVEDRTGGAVSAMRVRKWLTGDAAPDFFALLHLIRAYGADFLVFVIGDAPESLLEAALVERRARYLESVKKLEEEFESLSSR